VLGQLVTAVVIDLLWPTDAGPAAWQIVTMVAIAAASVLVALVRRRRR
jgi:transporter family-2 protein